MYFQRLIDGRQRVETVGARRANPKPEIDFAVGADRGWHTRSF
jgi:hypothetical protein